MDQKIPVLAVLIGNAKTILVGKEASLASQYASSNNDYIIGTSNSENIYLTGIAKDEPLMVMEHDPNRLEVMKICTDENGEKTITFRLTMYNTVSAENRGQKITIKELTNGRLLPGLTVLSTSEAPHREPRSIPYVGSSSNEWSFSESLIIPSIPPGADPSLPHNNFGWVEFSVKASSGSMCNKDSLMLKILGATVEFSGARDCGSDCYAEHEPFNFCVERFNCDIPSPSPSPGVYIVISIAAILALILLFRWLRRRRYKRPQLPPR
ncbi:MAG: hypothetical protein IT258_17590 [Saprospiraceae bacterium]|nr:hypothetical protein [Saprospiraceae bacterium]